MTTAAHQLAAHPTVKALSALQSSLSLSDAGFVKAVNLGYSASTWGRIKAAKYAAPGKVLPSLQAALDKSEQSPAITSSDFVKFSHVETALDSLAIAEATAGPNRLVFFVAPTGGGKTALIEHVKDTSDAGVIEAAPSWRKSYLAALCDIATQLHIAGDFRSVRKAESAIITSLRSYRRTLAIDEGNYFSQDGLNFLKLILNRTSCAILLCTLPTDFNRMLKESAHEANQLVRRSVSIVRVPPVSPKDVEAIQEAMFPKVALGKFAGKVAEQANRFGRYDLVRRVLDEAEPENSEDIPHAIERVKALINTQTVIS